LSLSGFLYLIPYILSALICAGISFYALQRRALPGALAFAFLAGSEMVWTLGYILQLVSPTLDGKLLWNNLQFLGAVSAPVAYLAFSFAYAGRKIKPSTWRIILALAAAILLLIWTDGLHHLFRVNPSLAPGFLFSELNFANGPTFLLYPFLAYLLLIVGSYIMFQNYISAPRAFRWQIATVIVSVLIPWITTFVTWLNLVPFALHEITPLTFAVSNTVVAWALFRYHLFDLVPIANETLLENMEDGVIVVDPERRIAEINPAAQRILNLSLKQAFGRQLAREIPVLAAIEPALKSGVSGVQELQLRVGDEDRDYEVRFSSITNNRHRLNGSLMILRDITDRKRTEEKLHQLAVTDPLTGLFNRRYFFEVAEREFELSLRRGRAFAIIIFDVDHFKNVNDTYGHVVGDQVLQSLTGRCLQSLRAYDVMARYGGEEFIIMLPETDAASAWRVAERLRTSIVDTPIATKAGPAEVTISLGVASVVVTSDLTFDKLIDWADQALLQVKRRGRNQTLVWGEEGLKNEPLPPPSAGLPAA
jgi:diguanylate cyclase (GGDEF)-like protein/PAS domain S-box-containing protein